MTLNVKGVVSQTASLFNVEDSTGSDKLTVSANGETTINSLKVSADTDIGDYGFRASDLTADNLTPGKVVFTGVNGLLSVHSNFSFDSENEILSVSNLTANDSLTVNAGVSITGDTTNEVTLNVKGVANQTASLFNVENSDGDVKLTVSANGNVSLSNNLTVTGDLTITGTTTTVNSTTVTVDDPIITLGGDTVDISDVKDRGIEFRYHDGTSTVSGFMGYDYSSSKFTLLTDATNTSEVFSGTTGSLVANLEGTVTSTGSSSFGSITVGGGFGDTGLTISSGGSIQTNGTIESSGGTFNGNVSIADGAYDFDIVSHDGSAYGLKLGGTLVTATSSQINFLATTGLESADFTKLAAITATSSQINFLATTGLESADFTKLAAITATSSQINFLATTGLESADFTKLAAITASDTELNYLDDSTPGTAVASKALVLGSSKDVTGMGTIGCGAITSTGQITASSFSGSLAASDLTGDIQNARITGGYTNITSIYNTSLAIGRSSDGSRIDFSTSNQVKIIQATTSAVNTPVLSLVNSSDSTDADTCMNFVQHDNSWAFGIRGNSGAFVFTYKTSETDTADLDDSIVMQLFQTYIYIGRTTKFYGNIEIQAGIDLVFEGVGNFETHINVINPTADRSINFADSSGTLVPFSSSIALNAGDVITATPGELNYLNGVSAGTAAISKALVLGTSKEVSGMGTIGCGAITSTGNSSFSGSLAADNIKIDGNTIFSTNTNGDINISPDGTGDVLICGGSGSTGVTITDGGAITAFGDITSNASDKRLKKDICIIENPLDKLKKLSGFTFNWNKEKCEEVGFKPKYERKEVGVFAQDIEEVLPEAVRPAPFDSDKDGNSKSGDKYLTVQYEKLVALLIESNKALLERVEELEKIVKK